MAKGCIEHRAKVISIEKDVVKVEILNKSACASCHAKGFCGSADVKAKVIEIQNPDIPNLMVGEEVLVILKESLGMKAALISYLIPLIILLILLLYLPLLVESELAVGLLVIGALALYFFSIFLFRRKISKKFIFYLQKLD